MADRASITPQDVREALDYDAATGVFTWKWRDGHPTQWNRHWPGREAGRVFRPGRYRHYRSIRLNGITFYAHRLAWAHHYGEWPAAGLQIDHINGNGLDNRIDNLRLATPGQNGANRGAQSNNSTGLKGVGFHKASGKYRAFLTLNGRSKHLGLYETPELAHEAYKAAAREAFGDFASTEETA